MSTLYSWDTLHSLTLGRYDKYEGTFLRLPRLTPRNDGKMTKRCPRKRVPAPWEFSHGAGFSLFKILFVAFADDINRAFFRFSENLGNVLSYHPQTEKLNSADE